MTDFIDIKALRKRYSLSQAQLGKLAGIPQARIARWEVRGTIPKVDDYQKILKALSEIAIDSPIINQVKKLSAKLEFMAIKYLPISAREEFLSSYASSKEKAYEALEDFPVLKEAETANYLVVEMLGDSMNINDRKSIQDRDKMLAKEIEKEVWIENDLPLDRYIYIILTKKEIIVAQITGYSKEHKTILYRPWNPLFKAGTVSTNDILDIMYVSTIVDKKMTS